MGVEEFAAITPRELFNKMKGARDYNSYLQVEAWSRARFVATQVWNSQLTPEDRLKPEQLLWLEGDAAIEEVKEEKSTPASFAEACRKFNVPIPQGYGG